MSKKWQCSNQAMKKKKDNDMTKQPSKDGLNHMTKQATAK
jgi:hypothetical protein